MNWPFEQTKAGYLNMWKSARIKPGADATNADHFASIILKNEQRYGKVATIIGCPWYAIGAIHMREASCSFAGVLHNGEKIIGTGRKTHLVPAGRGPFDTWEDAAIDALRSHNWDDWDWAEDTIARILWASEVYNGLGYVGKGVNSAYVWAGTNHEQPGKYVRDRVWDGTANDSQIGIACILLRLVQRPDIAAELAGAPKPPAPRPQPDVPKPPPPPPRPSPPPPRPAAEGFWDRLRGWFGN